MKNRERQRANRRKKTERYENGYPVIYGSGHRNCEGYRDPTAGVAYSRMIRDEKKTKAGVAKAGVAKAGKAMKTAVSGPPESGIESGTESCVPSQANKNASGIRHSEAAARAKPDEDNRRLRGRINMRQYALQNSDGEGESVWEKTV